MLTSNQYVSLSKCETAHYIDNIIFPFPLVPDINQTRSNDKILKCLGTSNDENVLSRSITVLSDNLILSGDWVCLSVG